MDTNRSDTPRSDTALIVIDVQESFRQRPNWLVISPSDIVDRVNRLVAAARDRGELIVWVLHGEAGTGDVFDPAMGHVRPIDGLAPRADEPVITKTSHNAFTTTNLQQLLTTRGIREVVICGIRTEQCCETTARVASDLGFDVTFVTDATATNPIEHWDAPRGRSVDEILADPRTLSAADIITRTEYALAGRFATIRTVDDLTNHVPTAPAPTAPAPTAPAPTASIPTASAPMAPALTASAPAASAPTVPSPTASARTAAMPTSPAPTAPAPMAAVPTASGPTAVAPTAAAPGAPAPTGATASAPAPAGATAGGGSSPAGSVPTASVPAGG